MGDCHAQSDLQSIPLQVTKTTEVPACSVLLIQANMEGLVSNIHEGLVKPGYSSNFPSHLLIARSLSEVGPSQEVLTQIVNITLNQRNCTQARRLESSY